MYSQFDIQEEINSLYCDRCLANTIREKIMIDRKIRIKSELFQIVKNKRHYVVV